MLGLEHIAAFGVEFRAGGCVVSLKEGRHRSNSGLVPGSISLTRTHSAPCTNRFASCSRARLLVCNASRNPRFGDDPLSKVGLRRKALLKYVQEVEPQEVQEFLDTVSPVVSSAMKQTVSGIIGTLPPQYFQVSISTAADSLAQLMISVMMTGYLFKNAQIRMELQDAFGGDCSTTAATATALPAALELQPAVMCSSAAIPAVPAVASAAVSTAPAAAVLTLEDNKYAPGVQKTKVKGEVLRWHLENGLERLDARQYMEMLEAEVAVLRQALAESNRKAAHASASCSGAFGASSTSLATTTNVPPVSLAAGGAAGGSAGMVRTVLNGSGGAALAGPMATRTNDLLAYLATLQPSSLAELTSCASADTLEAMHSFIGRLMGSEDKDQLRNMTSEFSAAELSKVLFWLMVVAYQLRCLELRMEMDGDLGLPPGGPGLLRG